YALSFPSRRRHTRFSRDWSSDVCSSDLYSRYFLISPINRSLLSPKLDGATGNSLQVLVSYAETCFYIAEFITKRYAGGVNTGGKIGRASCRERRQSVAGNGSDNQKNTES